MSAESAKGRKAGRARIEVAEPRRRIFLPQKRTERFAAAVWSLLQPFLFRSTPRVLNRWRVFLLRCFGAKIDSSTFVHQSARIDFPWNLIIGPDCVIEHGVILNCMGDVVIGPRSRISQYAHLCAGTHEYLDPTMPIVRKPITIGSEVWIAADAFVGPGVTIGDGSVLAARSSAFGDLPAGCICVGEPARPRKKRFEPGVEQDAEQRERETAGERG